MKLPLLSRKKPPILLSKSAVNINDAYTAKHYLGSKVFSTSGDYVGRVRDIIIKENQLLGIIVLGKKKLYIDRDYCMPGIIDSIILKIDPVTMLRRKLVFDVHGKKIGRVKDIERKTIKNECDHLIVKKHIFAKPKLIPYTDVETSKKNIILHKAY